MATERNLYGENIYRGEAAFVSACDQMSVSKFIMSDMHVTYVLKTIASSSNLYKIFADCVKNYDFRAVFAALKEAMEQGRFVMVFPDTREEYLAFIFSLLFEIDSKRLNFTKLLQAAYMRDTDNLNRAYAIFCAEVIQKFKATALSALKSDYRNSMDEFGSPALSVAQAEEASIAISDLIVYLSKHTALNYRTKDELYSIAQSLSGNLRGSKKLLAALFYGLRNTASPYTYLNMYIENLYKIFKAYGVVDA